MATKIETRYEGSLRTHNTHVASGNTMLTDAPVDNHGKGETFSPTDLIATSLLSCMITVMAIRAEPAGMNMGKVTGTVEKTMANAPRRVAALNVTIDFKGHHLSKSEKTVLENLAINCPVAKSIHPDIVQNVKFSYD